MSNIVWKPQTEIDAERKAQAWERVRAERDRRIGAVEWVVQRHAEEQALGIETTLTEAQYTEVLQYKQALRDVPQDNEDADNINWPPMPEFL